MCYGFNEDKLFMILYLKLRYFDRKVVFKIYFNLFYDFLDFNLRMYFLYVLFFVVVVFVCLYKCKMECIGREEVSYDFYICVFYEN